jgi:hypothetical protein
MSTLVVYICEAGSEGQKLQAPCGCKCSSRGDPISLQCRLTVTSCAAWSVPALSCVGGMSAKCNAWVGLRNGVIEFNPSISCASEEIITHLIGHIACSCVLERFDSNRCSGGFRI